MIPMNEVQDDRGSDARFWADVAGKVEAARAHRSTAAANFCMVDILAGYGRLIESWRGVDAYEDTRWT